MKLFRPATGGHRLYLEDFTHMQEAYKQIAQGICSSFQLDVNAPLILSGVDRNTFSTTISGTSPISLSSPSVSHIFDQDFLLPLIEDSGYTTIGDAVFYLPAIISVNASTYYSKGYIFFNDELFYFPGGVVAPKSTPGPLPTLGPHPNPFFRIVEFEVAPPDPIEYADGSVKHFIHTERVLMIKDYNEAHGDLEGVNGFFRNSLNSVKSSLVQKGMRVEWEQSYPNEINDVFDSTGLGIGRMAGWAICNGLNGTPDLRGQFTAMASTNMKNTAPLISGAITALSVGARIGERNNTFSINKSNLPNYNITATAESEPHRHAISGTSQARNTSGSGSIINQVDVGDYQHWKGALSYTSSETVTTHITINTGGGNVPITLNNIPPLYASIKIQRII